MSDAMIIIFGALFGVCIPFVPSILVSLTKRLDDAAKTVRHSDDSDCTMKNIDKQIALMHLQISNRKCWIECELLLEVLEGKNKDCPVDQREAIRRVQSQILRLHTAYSSVLSDL